jgi:hypothetical protein
VIEGLQGTPGEEKKRFWPRTTPADRQGSDKFSLPSGYFLVIPKKYGINIPYGKSVSRQWVLLTVSNDRASPVQ